MAASVRTWVLVAALALALVMLPRRPAVVEAEESVAAATAKASHGIGGAGKPKCQPGAATGPCRVGAVHDPENSEEEGLFSMRATAPPTGAPDEDYFDPDLSKNDDLVVLGH
uniref:Uncharacterized protein n=1 Tax=Oryza punctata TaxID=4537 RepID=A0A0E0LDS9_ORYPU